MSRQIDRRGQDAVVPIAAAVGLAGFALMVCAVQFGLPFWLNYAGALLASALPNASALARARWAYLVETRCLGAQTPMLKSTYAFEGIIEDVAFMVGPAASIAFAAATVPVGGVAVDVVVYVAGAVVLLSSKDTAPSGEYLVARQASGDAQKHSAILAYPMVLILFIVMVLVGCMYGAFDTSAISYAEAMAWMNSGMSVGMVAGPVTAGAIIDTLAPHAGFRLASAFSLALVAVAFVSVPAVRKAFRRP